MPSFPQIHRCPHDEILTRFCDGRLSDHEMTSIEEHLTHCEHCSDLIAELHSTARGDASTLVQWIRLAENAAEPDDSDVDKLLERLHRVNASPFVVDSPSDNAGSVRRIRGRRRLVSHRDRTPDPIPERIGPYFIVRLLAGGGMGRVLLARDDQRDRLVAIKVPRRDKPLSDRKLKTFLNEARQVSELRHPSIVQIYDFDRTEDGMAYVVMQYIHGTSLSDVIASGRLPPRAALRIARSVANALAFIHSRGCVHRDIKPGNILIDGKDKVWLTDFGLSFRESATDEVQPELAGTLPYMSPEQLQGDPWRLDGRSDIWSLGVVLFEMLTGVRPFVAGSLREALSETGRGLPLAPSRVAAPIPVWLDHVCQQCICPERDKRIPNARALSRRLRSPLTRFALRASPVLCLLSLGTTALSIHIPDNPLESRFAVLTEHDQPVRHVLQDGSGVRLFPESEEALVRIAHVNPDGFLFRSSLQFSPGRMRWFGVCWKSSHSSFQDRDATHHFGALLFIVEEDGAVERVVVARIQLTGRDPEVAILPINPAHFLVPPSNIVRLDLHIPAGAPDRSSCRVVVNENRITALEDRLHRLLSSEPVTGPLCVFSRNGPVEFKQLQVRALTSTEGFP